MAGPGKTGPEKTAIRADHARQIFELGLTGESMAAIAEVLNRSVAECYKLQQQYIRDLLTPLADEARKVELARLDRLLLALEPLIQQHDVKAIAEARANIERRSKLLGLDTPAEVKHTVRLVDAVDEEIMRIAAEIGERPAVES